MNTDTLTSEIKLTKTNAGVLRVGNTRVSLDSVIIAFQQGATPEEIIQSYDTLTLTEVYAAISYYLQNREEMDNYLAERAIRNEQLRKINDERFGYQGIRDKLSARRDKINSEDC